MPTVLITGATAGIGRACVTAFAEAGWHVVATGRRADRLAALASDRVRTLAFDIRDDAAREAALAGLPAPQFKLMNVRKFREASPMRHKAVLDALEKSLG